MGIKTGINYCDHTWNPWQGCHKVSDGCLHCYMYREKKHFGQDPNVVIRSSDKTFNSPLKWKEPGTVFVCSWSDFFIEEADAWRSEAWDIIQYEKHLMFLIVTKRTENILSRLPEDWGKGYPNVCLIATAETQEMADKRLPELMAVPAAHRGVSLEPMLSEIFLRRSICVGASERQRANNINLIEATKYPDWVIVGTESGPNRRPAPISWIAGIVSHCREVSVPVFVKQIEVNGRVSHDMTEWPEYLRVQQIPAGFKTQK